MGFVASGTGLKPSKQPSLALLHRLECKVCPLNKIKENDHPHIPAQGAAHPDVYMLGEAPGKAEDRHNKLFCGDSGKVLRDRIPDGWDKRLRWNNVVRTRPPSNRNPEFIEIEACRPSIIRDIEQSKPKAIFGFGAIPLKWATKLDSGITTWRGRRTPVRIGKHECWYYAINHPAAILHEKDENRKRSLEQIFTWDLERAFADVQHLPPAEVHDRATADYGIEVIDGHNPDDFARLESSLRWAMKQDSVGVDYETNGTRPYAKGAKILTAAVGTHEASFAFALRHRQSKWSPRELKRVEALWVEFLRSKVRKIVHFLRFEMEWSAFFYGWDIVHASRWEGTESQACVIDERPGAFSLEFLIQQHFGFNLKAQANLDKANLDNEPLADVLWYNAGDAKYHFNLFHAQDAIIKQKKIGYLYEEMLERVPTCTLTQLKGMPIDAEETQRLVDKYEDRIETTAAEIAEQPEVIKFKKKFGHKFKPLSDDDCAMMFKDLLGYKEGYRDDGKYSVDEKTLNEIDSELGHLLLRMRKSTKRLSTYVYRNTDKKTIVWPDGMLHPNFNTVFVRTKRLSADDPNAQNMPKRDEEAKEVRAQIACNDDELICSVDHGQIQARGIAMSSRDKAFCKSLWERFDVHQHWAEHIAVAYPARIGCGGVRDAQSLIKAAHADKTKKGPDYKTLKGFRGDIKNQWTFPLFFGAHLPRVAEELSIPEYILEPEFKAFQKMFAGVFEWHEELVKFYNKHGYVEDLFGFRHHAPLSHNKIINSPIQSLEALFVMRGMNRLSRHATKVNDYHYQPIAQIHDDLTFILPKKKAERYVDRIVTEMLGVTFPFVNIPLTLEVSIGNDLMRMEECLVASSDDWRKAA